jgi:MFS family permease
MSLAPYRQVLAVPGVRALLLVGVLARIPATAIGMTLTLHVATTLGRPWTQAGLVTAAFTVGGAVGAPLLGRLIDRRGLRAVMVLTTTVAAVVWFAAPHLAAQAARLRSRYPTASPFEVKALLAATASDPA